jgi:membrane protein DedA with SNARE-associated domain
VHWLSTQLWLLSDIFPSKMEWITMIAEYRYVGVFAFLFACGLGFPMPEEVALVGGGYAVYLDEATRNSWPHVMLMVTVAMVGVLVGDALLWYIGRRVGESPEKVPVIGRHLTPQRMRRARAMFRKHGAKAVFFGRFLFGIRAVTFFVSGSMRVPLGLFLLMDGLAALLTVPISVILAWHFGGELESAFDAIRRLDAVVLIGVGVAFSVALGLFIRHRKTVLSLKDAELLAEESETEIPTVAAPEAEPAPAVEAAAVEEGPVPEPEEPSGV